jgi:hypothetical protein
MTFNKKIFCVLLILLSIANVSAQKTPADKKLRAELVGVWHASPFVGSGMNDNFQFFADGTFRFNFNWMILSKRIVSQTGKWEISGGKLILTITGKTEIVGGRKIKSELSADGFEIEGGELVESVIDPPVKQTKILSAVRQDEIYKMISIGGVKYWRLSEDPKAYEN